MSPVRFIGGNLMSDNRSSITTMEQTMTVRTSRASSVHVPIQTASVLNTSKARRLLVKMEDAGELIAQRALAHIASPERARVAPDSLEGLLAATVNNLPSAARTKLVDSGRALLSTTGRSASATADSKLTSPIAAFEQIFGAPKSGGAGGGGNDGAPSAGEGFKTIKLKLSRVDCIKETTLETGLDEIVLVGTLISPTQTVSSFAEDLGQFKKEQSKSFNRTLKSRSLGSGNDWPRSFVATTTLVERDALDVEAFMKKLAEHVKEEVNETIEDGYDGDEPWWVILLRDALKIILNAILKLFSGQWIETRVFEIEVESPSEGFGDGDDDRTTTQIYSGWGGRYRARYIWALD